MARVAALFQYPVKGCAGVEVSEGLLGRAGLGPDRTFMVVDAADGDFLSQRKDPRLAVVRPDLTEDGARLTLSAPGLEPVEVRVDPGESPERSAVSIHGKPYTGVDQGESVADWFSTLLGRPCRLVRVPPEHDRLTSGETEGTAGFADSTAVLMTSTASLAELNDRLAAKGEPALPMNRFRPNVVVDGWDEPHVEDRVRRVEIGEAEIGFAKLAARCAVTMVDQGAGERRGPEPLRTLADYRRVDGGVVFGVRCAVTRAGKVSVGDGLRVTRWASP
ncbi:MOSC N-terminal beta barrel domain-containing protein [Saccharomonospora sp. NB11]|uniref:MOSC domain-containing protein n=1 Tax=Saccharomonospora sp. NB11 TaxID=1642298 RepID=UPI0018D1951C|nr:MOSC N-terminal beta barrel domain-containing protein [Saccharomonospora sp. NB11]